MIEIIGGPGRDRTDDLFHAMEARSQLRHRPTWAGYNFYIVSAGNGFVKLPGRRPNPLPPIALRRSTDTLAPLRTPPCPPNHRVTHITCSEPRIRNNQG